VVLRESGDGVICIGQASHAWLSGQLARAWGNDAFPRIEPWEELVLAALQHDIGMAEWDLAPALDPGTGRPRSFMDMPPAVHMSLWSGAATKLLTQSRYAALLVSMHGTALYELRDLGALPVTERRLIETFLGEQRAWQDTVMAAIGVSRSDVHPAQRLVWNWDLLSLILCVPWEAQSLEGVPARDGLTEVTVTREDEWRWRLSPWPFGAPAVAVRCEGRRLEGRAGSEAELHRALARAPVERLEFSLRPGGR
jgi:hypothetical protein